MFDKMRIKEHMEIAGKNGQHVGTVDEVEGDRIKMTKTDSGDSRHHYIEMELVDRVEDNRIYLKVDEPTAQDMKV
ncbi:DUF2171 domain-containing protein [Stakelama sp. CBK3Z-3]|uniref:DUF2171 domain-containing protein n=1 Tax=Stakelama flava TaxID=2860338 RepID=A0ABS6XPE5_9SPHN|nr:DUF2171 domain-containing protein [Stakelama flava]MBW4331744.1 DUF2171 domain-containing protein [Stakelama flava]